jgi:hypothetical protein
VGWMWNRVCSPVWPLIWPTGCPIAAVARRRVGWQEAHTFGPGCIRAGAGWRAPSALSGARGSPQGAPPAEPELPVTARTIVAAAAITAAAGALLASRIRRCRRQACPAKSGRSFRQGSKPRSRGYSLADGHHTPNLAYSGPDGSY